MQGSGGKIACSTLVRREALCLVRHFYRETGMLWSLPKHRHKYVTLTPNGLDARSAGVALVQLAPQLAHRHVDFGSTPTSLGIGVAACQPRQFLSRHDFSSMASQYPQDLEFRRGQWHACSGGPYRRARSTIDGKRADYQSLGPGFCHDSSAQQRAYPRQQYYWLYGPDDVIVGAGFQCLHMAAAVVRGAQNQDRRLGDRTKFPACLQAIATSQLYVDNRHRRLVVSESLRRLVCTIRLGNLEPVQTEESRDQVRHSRLLPNKQNLCGMGGGEGHSQFLWPRATRDRGRIAEKGEYVASMAHRYWGSMQTVRRFDVGGADVQFGSGATNPYA